MARIPKINLTLYPVSGTIVFKFQEDQLSRTTVTVYDGDRKQQRRRHTNTITQQSKMFWSYKKMSKQNSLVPEIVASSSLSTSCELPLV